jgi:hypothetical protein
VQYSGQILVPLGRNADIERIALVDHQYRGIDIPRKKSGAKIRDPTTNRRLGSLFLEILPFVPAGVVLALLILPPFLTAKYPWLNSLPANRIAFYAGLGTISYGFPFAAIRHAVTRVALNTLREFVNTGI